MDLRQTQNRGVRPGRQRRSTDPSEHESIIATHDNDSKATYPETGAGEAERTISVVIPTFDRAHLLPRALDSVFAQERPADEVIVVDDGSRDETATLVRRDYPRARLLRTPHRGVSAARNAGAAVARGSWLAFLDSDDAWLPEKLAAQEAALEAAPDAVLVHADEIWIRNGVRVNPRRRHAKRGGWIFQDCLPLCVISPSAALVRRSTFDAVGAFDEGLPACEDYDLWLRITSRHPVLFVDRPLLVKHGGHDDQLSRTTEALDRYRIRALTKILASGHLGPEDRRAAARTLCEKIRVYGAGARKRGRLEEAARLEALAAKYAEETTETR
jgi:glycosyltransferase involved in cell wall biosynthesis